MQPGRSRAQRATAYNARRYRVPETDPRYLSGGKPARREECVRALTNHSA
jgi:hypothetical protein